MAMIALCAVLLAGSVSSCSSKENRFDKAIEQLNSMLPMNLGNGFTMEKVSSDGDGIVYTIKCDDNEIDMNMMEENKEELRQNTLAQLKQQKRSNNKDFATLLDYCKESNKNIIYKYVGNPSKKTVEISINTNEI
ncbi:MAG: hypothetical protein NC204_07275 [Candidatus Amulumruptor caecigallinarius]|nr:hypothetical protein [Candidatus Amulumruptor caecigallinarius]